MVATRFVRSHRPAAVAGMRMHLCMTVSDDAYERLVEELLQSPRYGERWARHWLDVVRFAESDGFETNRARPTPGRIATTSSRRSTTTSPTTDSCSSRLAGDASARTQRRVFSSAARWDRVKIGPGAHGEPARG